MRKAFGISLDTADNPSLPCGEVLRPGQVPGLSADAQRKYNFHGNGSVPSRVNMLTYLLKINYYYYLTFNDELEKNRKSIMISFLRIFL